MKSWWDTNIYDNAQKSSVTARGKTYENRLIGAFMPHPTHNADLHKELKAKTHPDDIARINQSKPVLFVTWRCIISARYLIWCIVLHWKEGYVDAEGYNGYLCTLRPWWLLYLNVFVRFTLIYFLPFLHPKLPTRLFLYLYPSLVLRYVHSFPFFHHILNFLHLCSHSLIVSLSLTILTLRSSFPSFLLSSSLATPSTTILYPPCLFHHSIIQILFSRISVKFAFEVSYKE